MEELEEIGLSISLVIPVYSGQDYLLKLISKINELREDWRQHRVDLDISELLFVLDDPIDESATLLREKMSAYPWLRMIELSRNFGQHSATVAGILYSSGDWIVTMDEDLQHHPFEIEKLLLEACEKKADVVYALPKKSVHGGIYRDFSARITKRIISILSKNPAVTDFNSFRLIRGDIARAAASICAQNTYFDVALTWFTTRISSVRIDLKDERHQIEKQSGYQFLSLVKHAKRLLLTSNVRVLWFASIAAIISFFASISYSAWIIYLKLFSETLIDVPGWASLMIVILAFGGIGIFMLGVITDLLHMSMLQILGKPAFFVVNRSKDDMLAREVKKFNP